MWVIIVLVVGASAFAMATIRQRRVVGEELSELTGDGFDQIRANYDFAMAAGLRQTTRPVIVRTTRIEDSRPAAA